MSLVLPGPSMMTQTLERLFLMVARWKIFSCVSLGIGWGVLSHQPRAGAAGRGAAGESPLAATLTSIRIRTTGTFSTPQTLSGSSGIPPMRGLGLGSSPLECSRIEGRSEDPHRIVLGPTSRRLSIHSRHPAILAATITDCFIAVALAMPLPAISKAVP